MSKALVDPILVVGAGPTGLSLALALVKNGIPVRIINKAQAVHQEQRGLGIQPRTLEVFSFLGVLPDVLDQGTSLQPIKWYKMPGGREVMSTMSLSPHEEPTPTQPLNNTFQIPQFRTEAILRAHLQAQGCEVEAGTELVSVEQFDDRVEATIKKAEIVETRSYPWIIGADGGRSVVRKQIGLSFEGSSTPERWVMGELELGGLDSDHWHAWVKLSEDPALPPTHVLIRAVEPGRFFFIISGNIDPDKVLASKDALKEALRNATDRPDLAIGDILQTTDYRPSIRMVNNFGEGRAFVAGDAAHVHTPRGGQGLNSGVQDAFNLGWKLALVHKGLAPRALLDTYTDERLPVIAAMLQETVKLTERMEENKHHVERLKAALGKRNHLKQFGINYRWSRIVRDERAPWAADGERDPYGVLNGDEVRAGDRAPNATGLVSVADSKVITLFEVFSPTRHTALIFGGDAARAEAIVKALRSYPHGLVTSVVVLPHGEEGTKAVDGADAILRDGDGVAYEAYGMTGGQAYTVIVRPDGVVGAVASGEDGVGTYFGNILSSV